MPAHVATVLPAFSGAQPASTAVCEHATTLPARGGEHPPAQMWRRAALRVDSGVADRPIMSMNETASAYLRAFGASHEIPGGLSYRSALLQSELDYSPTSLERIDLLLDAIREQQQPEYGAFLSVHANQNFMYLLAFYVGTVVGRATGGHVEWWDYEDMAAAFPEMQQMFPRCFGSSVSCNILGGEKGGFFVPLASIEARLFEHPPTKSVAFSAGSFM
jgi:hypothetical protein